MLRNRKILKIALCVLALAAVVALVFTVSLFSKRRGSQSSASESSTSAGSPHELLDEPIPAQESEEEASEEASSIQEQEEASAETDESGEDAVAVEEEEKIVLTPEGHDHFLNVKECRIDSTGENISIICSSEHLPISDTEYYYVFEMKPYETVFGTDVNSSGIDGRIEENTEPVLAVPMEKETTFSLPLLYGTDDNRLYRKFVVAVLTDGIYAAVTGTFYVTNPEAKAEHTAPYLNSTSIKGLLIDPNKLNSGELQDLGVSQGIYNIPMSTLFGESTNAGIATIYYTFNGKSYAFNPVIVAQYDIVFSKFQELGIKGTAVLLNDANYVRPQLIHPRSRGGSAYYYMFNAAEDDGISYIGAAAAFLADRYSGNGHGLISNFIIGNEINARSDWNYMEYTDLVSYTREYANAFRVMYNAIKSRTSGAKVFISLDQQWNRNSEKTDYYDAKDLLDSFAEIIDEEGNIDWNVAIHPYAYPLTNTAFWQKKSNLVLQTADTSILTMENFHVLTDYLSHDAFLNEEGEVRHVIISELGYSAYAGEVNQAAAFVYAYKVAEANPYVDALILSRETDAAAEIAQELYFGLSGASGRRYIYDVYKHIDQADSDAYTQFALGVLGISDFSEITQQ